ncbi:hypothetical protein ACPXCG_13570 [Gordonia sp. DT218]|uniref:hypothetical protein n=1 Tax=Gordonia sp. DT218 TaxID=3416659 RepID=UPI003CED1562
MQATTPATLCTIGVKLCTIGVKLCTIGVKLRTIDGRDRAPVGAVRIQDRMFDRFSMVEV